MKDSNWYLVWTRKDSKDEYAVKYYTFRTQKDAFEKRKEVSQHPDNYSTRIHNKKWYDSTVYSLNKTDEYAEEEKTDQENRLRDLLNL